MTETKELMELVDMVAEFAKSTDEDIDSLRSSHEGVAYVENAFEDVIEEAKALRVCVSDLKKKTYKGYADEKEALMPTVNQVALCASLLACSAINTASMAKKFADHLCEEESYMTAEEKREEMLKGAKKQIDKIPDEVLENAKSATVCIKLEGEEEE